MPGLVGLVSVFGLGAGAELQLRDAAAVVPQLGIDLAHGGVDVGGGAVGQKVLAVDLAQKVILPLKGTRLSMPMQKICELTASTPSSTRWG